MTGRRMRGASAWWGRPTLTGADGMSLIELVIILGVLVILASAVRPTILNQVVAAQTDATRSEAKALYEGMVGTPAPDSFGFVGDLGRLPRGFAELVERGGLPAYSAATVRNVGMGWKGPYVNVGKSPTDYLTDAFGRPYRGAASGQVISAGANGVMGDDDDIVFPPFRPVVTGTLSVVIKTYAAERVVIDPLGIEVHVYYAQDGRQAVRRDVAPPFVFPDLPMGQHAVAVLETTATGNGRVLAQATIVSPGNGDAKLVELWY